MPARIMRSINNEVADAGPMVATMGTGLFSTDLAT
jgi:hypothetical protein